MNNSTPPAEQLVRVLARGDVLALAFGAMVGWGWIVLTGGMIQDAGSVGAIIAFIIGGIAVVLIGLTYAELAAAMPKVGGEHVYSYRAMGHFSSFLCTWTIILGYLSVVSFEAVALPTVIENLAPNYAVGHMWTIAGWDVKATWVAVGVGGSLAMMAINYVGITTAALLQKVVTGVILIAGVLFVTGALFEGDVANMTPLFTQSEGGVVAGIIAVLVLVPFLFVGFDVIPQAAEEINLPYNAIGKVLMMSVVLAVVWYALIILATSMALDHDSLLASSLSVPDAMGALFNSPWASKLMILAGIAGIITSWNAFYIGGSRAIYALAHAGMLPAWLGKLHPKHKTPTNAVLLIGLLSCIAPFFGRPALVWIVDAGGLGIVIAYLFVAISFLILRIREPDMPRPFRVRHGKLCGTLATLLSFGMACLYLPGSPSALTGTEWLIFGAWMALGLVMYVIALKQFGRAYSDRVMAPAFTAQ
ncbi:MULTISPECIES: APC family permease [Cobetia]|uniref:APC family permease n=1 Tax=Cobetia amphilecti TaxID=1055104 RepID=A0AAP4TUE8_9GAMM|nr:MULTISPECIES: APC family permease [Cobetia]KPM75912.1 amino acid permease [Cobetia sp. UCD-24C]MDO6670545.1 APC family permease [Cobetia amphilecti]